MIVFHLFFPEFGLHFFGQKTRRGPDQSAILRDGRPVRLTEKNPRVYAFNLY